MNNTIEELLKQFEERGISLQITCDYAQNPTVHAFDYDMNIHKTTGQTVQFALKSMLEELFG